MPQTPRNNEATSCGQCKQSLTMDSFRLYPWVPSEYWDTRVPNMKQTGKAGRQQVGKQPRMHMAWCVISKIVQEKEYRTSLKELPNMMEIQRHCLNGAKTWKLICLMMTGKQSQMNKNMMTARDRNIWTRNRQKRRRPEELMQTTGNVNRNTWAGKWRRYQRILCCQEIVIVTSICFKQEKPGWI